MWNALLAKILGVSKQLAILLAPLIAGALADLLKKTAEKAVTFVKDAAADQTFPSGEARHTWVVDQVTPLVKETATTYIPQVRDAVINLAVKSVYDQLPK